MFTFFSDTDGNEKTISQSSALGGKVIGQDKGRLREKERCR